MCNTTHRDYISGARATRPNGSKRRSNTADGTPHPQNAIQADGERHYTAGVTEHRYYISGRKRKPLGNPNTRYYSKGDGTPPWRTIAL